MSTTRVSANARASSPASGKTAGTGKRRCLHCKSMSEYPVVYGHLDSAQTVALCQECRKEPEALAAKDERFAVEIKRHREDRNSR